MGAYGSQGRAEFSIARGASCAREERPPSGLMQYHAVYGPCKSDTYSGEVLLHVPGVEPANIGSGQACNRQPQLWASVGAWAARPQALQHIYGKPIE